MLVYNYERSLGSIEFIDLLERSTLGKRRPIADPARIRDMVRNANLIVTARDESGFLLGIARCVTDFSFCCYVSDLAVDAAVQRRGIGRELLLRVRQAIHEKAFLFLQAAPEASEYYPHIGFRKIDGMWSW